jgi:hypothetical protein
MDNKVAFTYTLVTNLLDSFGESIYSPIGSERDFAITKCGNDTVVGSRWT